MTLANYISNIAGRAANPYGAILAGAVVLAAPAVALFVVFQKRFTAAELSSGVKGMTVLENSRALDRPRRGRCSCSSAPCAVVPTQAAGRCRGTRG